MQIIFIDDKEKWNKFILANRGSFLQAFEWGELQEKAGRKVWRMWLTDERIDANQPIFVAQIIKHNLLFGKSYLYASYGPIFKRGIIEQISKIGNFLDKKREYFSEFLSTARKLCQEENAIFFKIEPLLKSESHKKYLLESGLKKSDKEIQPSRTLILDLSKIEEELLKDMEQKTRYNINLAQKRGVEIVKSDGYIDEFCDLMRQTAKRGGFSLHDTDYYRELLSAKSDIFENVLYVARFEGKILAGAIVNFFNRRATYLHGASSSENRNVMAPHLLHWEIIKETRARGMEQYDFWGISEKWPGVTRFKQGFGGKEITYLGAFDLVVDKKWYFLYSFARRIF